MNRYLVIFISAFVLILPEILLAQCHLDGRTYDEGEVVAGYVCRNGDWQEL